MSEPVDALAVMNVVQHEISWHSSIRAAELGADRDAVAELIEAACLVHAQVRAGKEPDLIALADCLDAVGAKSSRKSALANIGSAS